MDRSAPSTAFSEAEGFCAAENSEECFSKVLSSLFHSSQLISLQQ